MKIVFIAGAYFGNGNIEQIEINIREAEKYQIALANNGIGFFCPHNHTEHFEKKASASENFYRKLDMEFLRRASDAILMIPGWEKSKGAKAELEYAKYKESMYIFYPKSPQDISEIIEWANK